MNLLNFIYVSVNIEIVIGGSSALLRLVDRAQFVLIALTYRLDCRLVNKATFVFWLRKAWNCWIILDIKLILVMILHAQVVASVMIGLLIRVHRSIVSIGSSTRVRIGLLLLETVELRIFVLIQDRRGILAIELQVLKSPCFLHFDVWTAILRWVLVPLPAVILLWPLAIFIFVVKAVVVVHGLQLKVLVAPPVAIVRVHYLKVSRLFAHFWLFKKYYKQIIWI